MSYVEIITLPSTSQSIAHQTKPVHRPARLQSASLRPHSSSSSQPDRYIVSSSPAPALPSSSPSLAPTSSTPVALVGPMSYHRNLSQPWRLAPALPVISPPSANPFSPSGQRPSTRASVSEIIPRLLISDLSFAENPAMLASHRITHIMSTMPDNIFRPPPSLLPFQPARLQIKVEDLPFAELAAHLPTTTAWIRDALASSPDARVLVHCAEGVSRSVSVVAAYLMAQYGWTPVEALGYVKSKRRIADPNFGFVQQLHEYARDVLGRQVVIPTQPFSIP